jgi:hypothetical protein
VGERDSSFQFGDQQPINLGADHLDQLGLERSVHGLSPDEGERAVRAPPRELVPAITPVASLPLA